MVDWMPELRRRSVASNNSEPSANPQASNSNSSASLSQSQGSAESSIDAPPPYTTHDGFDEALSCVSQLPVAARSTESESESETETEPDSSARRSPVSFDYSDRIVPYTLEDALPPQTLDFVAWPEYWNPFDSKTPPFNYVHERLRSRLSTDDFEWPVSEKDRFAFLALFDTVFLVDDSISSFGRPDTTEAAELVSQVANVTAGYSEDGIDLYFVHHSSGEVSEGVGGEDYGGYRNVKSASQVDRIFEKVSLDTIDGPKKNGVVDRPVARALGKILEAYLARHKAAGDQHVKPANIVVLSNSDSASDSHKIPDVVQDCAEELDRRGAQAQQIGIHRVEVARRSRVGNDDEDHIMWGTASALCRRRPMVHNRPWRAMSGPMTSDEFLTLLDAVVSENLRCRIVNSWMDHDGVYSHPLEA